ncbi:hypothetical protein KKA87_16220, partial [bacterium]|nr:hypothetical protein [bacterium]
MPIKKVVINLKNYIEWGTNSYKEHIQHLKMALLEYQKSGTENSIYGLRIIGLINVYNEETEASSVATLGVLNTINAPKYGKMFDGAVALPKNKVDKNIDVTKFTLINSVSGSISMPVLAEYVMLLESVDGGLTAQVIEAFARHKEELDRRIARYSNILSFEAPTALNDAKCQEKLDIDYYQEKCQLFINKCEAKINRIQSLLQESFWIESNEKPIICPFDGYSSSDSSDLLRSGNSNKYLYKDCLYYADGLYTDEEKKLLIMENFDQERRKFERLKNKHEYSDDTKYQRPNIPESVRIIVWKRDSGKCVNCGSRENLEYDHI